MSFEVIGAKYKETGKYLVLIEGEDKWATMFRKWPINKKLSRKVLRTAKRIRWKDYKDEKGKFELDWMKEDESYLKFLWRYEK